MTWALYAKSYFLLKFKTRYLPTLKTNQLTSDTYALLIAKNLANQFYLKNKQNCEKKDKMIKGENKNRNNKNVVRLRNQIHLFKSVLADLILYRIFVIFFSKNDEFYRDTGAHNRLVPTFLISVKAC